MNGEETGLKVKTVRKLDDKPATGLFAVSSADRRRSSMSKPPSTTPITPVPLNLCTANHSDHSTSVYTLQYSRVVRHSFLCCPLARGQQRNECRTTVSRLTKKRGRFSTWKTNKQRQVMIKRLVA